MRLIFILFCLLGINSCQTVDAPQTIDMWEDWRFSPDDKNIGISENWHTRQFDDSHWATIDAGKRWEDQGYPDVDSLAWYRKVIDIPT